LIKDGINNPPKKVLHIWDNAAVSCVLAKFTKPYGYESRVIKRKKFDPFGVIKYYNQKYIANIAGPLFIIAAAKIASQADIVHIHSIFKLVPMIKNAKVILHYHGSDLRRNLDSEKRKYCESKADMILVSTPDLMQEGFNYLPNPVDTDLFKPQYHIEKNNKALTFSIRYLDMDLINHDVNMQHILDGMHHDIIDREKDPISYEKMPELLNKYNRYIDVKYVDGQKLKAYSVTGLQALACGLEVFNYDNKLVKGLPDNHRPENVAAKLDEYYKRLYE